MEKIKALFKGKKKFLTVPVAALLGLFFLPITILLLISWLIYIKVGNKKIKFAGLALIVVLTFFFGTAYISAIVSPTPPKQQIENPATPAPAVESQETEVISTPNSNRQEVKVIRVIDGDTIEIEGGQRVRYIGIDTPERDACFSSESTAKNKELVDGKTISLEKDVSEKDRYGRLLRYVYVGDTLVNEVLVKEGYAQVYTYPPDVKYNEKFSAAQREARDSNKGLWSACQATPTPTSKPTSTPKPVTSTPKPTTLTTPTQQPTTGGSWTCNCSKTCPQMSSCAEAQYQLNVCGCSARDADDDGIACDSQCQ